MKPVKILRTLKLAKKPENSFFLWGPRQTGKSTLLKSTYSKIFKIDLLNSEDFLTYSSRPQTLREQLVEKSEIKFVIIDEIQKVPSLLDEIHWLIENNGNIFALAGSSARKLRRGHANLLGGRADRYELFGFTSFELGNKFNLIRILNNGYIPRHYLKDDPRKHLSAYVADYLKEEIAAEGLIRNLPPFSDFLRVVAVTDTEMVNYTNIASDCGVSSPSVKEYYQILVDTMLGRYLPAYTRRQKRRVIEAPKFYISDVGVVNYLSKRGKIEEGSPQFGKAFENWVLHELHAYNAYKEKYFDFSYWKLASGIEVDFIINDAEYAIEVKGTNKVRASDLKGLRELIIDHPGIKKRYVISNEKRSRQTEDGISILSVNDFVKKLWTNKLFS